MLCGRERVRERLLDLTLDGLLEADVDTATAAVVGGGVSGLVCAQELKKRGFEVTVFDSGLHAPGGRCSTRTTSSVVRRRDGRHEQLKLRFDHSLQYFTVSDPVVQELVDELINSGHVRPWSSARLGSLANGKFTKRPRADGIPYIGSEGARSICEGLADGLDVVRPVWVSEVRWTRDCWELYLEQPGQRAAGPPKPYGTFDYLIIAHSGKCAENLMARSGCPILYRRLATTFQAQLDRASQLSFLQVSSIYTLCVAFEGSLNLPYDGCFIKGNWILSYIGNNNSKMEQTAGFEAWTLMSTPQFAAMNNLMPGQNHLTAQQENQIANHLLQAFVEQTGVSREAARTVYSHLQLWSAAVPLNHLAEGRNCLFAAAQRAGCCGDWLASPSFQGAATSGMELANVLAKHRESRTELDHGTQDLLVPADRGDGEVVEHIGHFPRAPSYLRDVIEATFDSRPLGLSIERQEQDGEVKAVVQKVDGPNARRGIVVGMLVESINENPTTESTYEAILKRLQTVPLPITVGFRRRLLRGAFQMTGNPITKNSIRRDVWDYMEKHNLANFPPVHHRIPNFVGANAAAERLMTVPELAQAQIVEIGPDKSQQLCRQVVLEAKKELLVPFPRMKQGLLHRVKLPNNSQAAAAKGATRKGMKEFGVPVEFGEKFHIDAVIVGSVAVSPSGLRLGKGEGFADLEWAMLATEGLVSQDTVLITTVHDCQVLGEMPAELFGEHDVPVDYICTPTRLIRTHSARPKPATIDWSKLTQSKWRKIPVLRELKKRHREKRRPSPARPQPEYLPPRDTHGNDPDRQPLRAPLGPPPLLIPANGGGRMGRSPRRAQQLLADVYNPWDRGPSSNNSPVTPVDSYSTLAARMIAWRERTAHTGTGTTGHPPPQARRGRYSRGPPPIRQGQRRMSAPGGRIPNMGAGAMLPPPRRYPSPVQGQRYRQDFHMRTSSADFVPYVGSPGNATSPHDHYHSRYAPSRDAHGYPHTSTAGIPPPDYPEFEPTPPLVTQAHFRAARASEGYSGTDPRYNPEFTGAPPPMGDWGLARPALTYSHSYPRLGPGVRSNGPVSHEQHATMHAHNRENERDEHEHQPNHLPAVRQRQHSDPGPVPPNLAQLRRPPPGLTRPAVVRNLRQNSAPDLRRPVPNAVSQARQRASMGFPLAANTRHVHPVRSNHTNHSTIAPPPTQWRRLTQRHEQATGPVRAPPLPTSRVADPGPAQPQPISVPRNEWGTPNSQPPMGTQNGPRYGRVSPGNNNAPGRGRGSPRRRLHESTCRIWIGGIPEGTRASELKKCLREHNVPYLKFDWKRRCAFITVNGPNPQHHVTRMQALQLRNKLLKVELARK